MTERFGAKTIANHLKNGITKMEREGKRRRGSKEDDDEVMFS